MRRIRSIGMLVPDRRCKDWREEIESAFGAWIGTRRCLDGRCQRGSGSPKADRGRYLEEYQVGRQDRWKKRLQLLTYR